MNPLKQQNLLSSKNSRYTVLNQKPPALAIYCRNVILSITVIVKCIRKMIKAYIINRFIGIINN